MSEDTSDQSLGLFAVWLSLSTKRPSEINRKVLVISLDGFPAYALKDPRLPVPTLRRLMREGSYADSMQPINPTVTWPNHTTMVTGVDASVHQVLWNGQLIPPHAGEAPHVDALRSKDDMVQAPTIYDLAFRAGLTTAQVDWVAINNASTMMAHHYTKR